MGDIVVDIPQALTRYGCIYELQVVPLLEGSMILIIEIIERRALGGI